MTNKFFLTICMLSAYILSGCAPVYALQQEASDPSTGLNTQTTETIPSTDDLVENDQAAPSSNLSQVSERFEVGEELIVTFRVGNLNYGELFVVIEDSGLFVSAEELISLLDFPINKFSTGEGYSLKGWFINESKTFELSMFPEQNAQGVGQVTIAGKSSFIPASAFKDVAGERLYNFDVVGGWFGLTLDFEVQSLSINAVAAFPLPAQSRLAREKKSLSQRGVQNPKHPNYDFGYFSRSHQLFDARISTSFRNEKLNGSYSVVGVQDVSAFSSRFFISGSDDDLYRSANLSLKRQSIDGDLLGFMKASNFEIGDIRASRVGNSTGGQSIGANISNQKLGQLYNLDVTNITGVIQSGWDVELYHNGVLVDKKLGTDGGQYEFLDVPLYGELNVFDVIKYGPQGQVVKERIERNVDAGLFDKRPTYNISLTRSNSSLFAQDQNSTDAQDWIFSGNYSYALNNWMSSSFGHSISLDDVTNNYYTLGLNARLSARVLAGATLNFVDKDNMGVGFNLRSRLFDQFVTIGFGANKSGDTISQSASLRMNGALYQGDLGSLSYSNEYTGSWRDTDNYRHNFNNTITYTNRLGYFSHYFSKALTKQDAVLSDAASGGLTLGAGKGMLNGRFSANYDLSDPEQGFEWLAVEASLSYAFLDNISSQATFSRAIATGDETISLGVDWRRDGYALNARVNHNSVGDTSVSLNARFSMAETPFGSGYVTSDRSMTSNALVAVRVFEDINQNFIFDGDDRPIPEVTVKAAQINRRAKTGPDGIALIEGVTSFRKTDLNVETGTLDDPYLRQSTISTSLTPRGGLLTLINYPFVQGVEFEGEVNFVDQYGETNPLANAPIEIVNSMGEVVKTLLSEFDGYFYSDILYPDTYTLRVSDSYIDRNELKINQGTIVNASKAGDLVASVSMTLKKKNYKVGYQVYLASLESEKAAKTLLKIYKIKWKNDALSQKLNVFRSFKDGKYYVGLGIYREKEPAENFCYTHPQLGDRCAVRQDRFDVAE